RSAAPHCNTRRPVRPRTGWRSPRSARSTVDSPTARSCCAPSGSCGWPAYRCTGRRCTVPGTAAVFRCRRTRSSRSGTGWRRDRRAAALREGVEFPDRLVHCWSLGGTDGPEGVAPLLARCYASLLHWAQATEPELMTLPQRWDVVSDGVFAVTGDERLYPAK